MSTADSRAGIIRNFLIDQNLDGWLSWRSDELLMQRGHVTYWGLSFLLVLRDGEKLLFTPAIEPEDGIPSDTIVVSYPWGNLAQADPFDSLTRQVQSELQRRHIAPDSIGFLRDSPRSSLPTMAAEQPPLPASVIEKVTAGMTANPRLESAFLALYLHKTMEEIERIRLANKVAQTGLAAWHQSLVPGATEAEAAAAAEYAIHQLIGSEGIASARGWAMVQSGPNTAKAGCFNRSSGRRIDSGDLVLIELATCVNGYWSDLTRTESVGPAPSEASDLLHAVSASQRAALQSIRPGVMAYEVDAAARASLAQAGVAHHFTHATGHQTGFRYHDPGFAIAPGSRELVRAGMVLTIEPGVYLAERGIGARIEDNIAVTADGIEVLSSERQECW